MTKDELMKHFSAPRYDTIREYVYRIMLERPDIYDPVRIAFAADKMEECFGDGVEIGVNDALRLTEKDTVPDMETLLKSLSDAGVTDDNIFDVIFSSGADGEDYSQCVPSRRAERSFRLLNQQADALAALSPDILVIGRPEFSRYADWARLAIALFCPTLTQTEQNIIKILKTISDDACVTQEPSYIKVEFFVEKIWEEPAKT